MSKLDDLIKEKCTNGVKVYTLGELGTFYGGLTGKSKNDFADGNAKFITYKNVYSNPALCLDVEDRVKIAEGEKQRTLEYGDIVFTGSSETPDECGFSSVVTTKTDEKLYLNSFCFFFRLNNPELLLPDFAKHLFRSDNLRYQIGKTASGVTRFNVSKERMKSVKIPVPPLEVQNEIVQILDNFAELTAELTAELSNRKKQYEYYRDLLLNFDENNQRERVKWLTIGEIGDIKMCKRILKSQTNSMAGIPFYKIGTFGGVANSYISEETYEEYKKKYSFPKKGDVLISAAGTIGRTVIYDGEPAYFQDSNIVWLKHDESQVLNKYLYYYYQLNPWQVSTGGTIARLYNDNILKAKIAVPSIDEQKRIIYILDSFSALASSISEGLPAEIEAREKQYAYYRDKLLSFKEFVPNA